MQKQRRCLKCNHINGVVKKAASGAGPAALKIVHDTFRWIGKKKLLKRQFGTRSWIKFSLEILSWKKFAKRIHDDLNPLKTLNLFKQITPQDCELFGLDPAKGGRPEMYIWRYLPAPLFVLDRLL